MNRCIRYNFFFGIVWRTVLFAALALLTAFRITNFIPLLVGAALILFDKKKYGQALGWLLALGAIAFTLLFYINYSVEGGFMY